MAAHTDEVSALKRRIEELERSVAEHESGAVVEPHLAANKDLEATCKRLRERNEQLERENSTLALARWRRQVNAGGAGAAAAARRRYAEVPRRGVRFTRNLSPITLPPLAPRVARLADPSLAAAASSVPPHRPRGRGASTTFARACARGSACGHWRRRLGRQRNPLKLAEREETRAPAGSCPPRAGASARAAAALVAAGATGAAAAAARTLPRASRPRLRLPQPPCEINQNPEFARR